MGRLDDNQAGFRQGKSTADATKVMVRIQEDVKDYQKFRIHTETAEQREEQKPLAKLLDLRKAYPRVSRPTLWGLLRRYGLKGAMMDTLMDLHETASNRVKG